MKEITLESFKNTLDALLDSNPHARNKGDVFKDWCLENFGIEARISHIREQRQTTNRVSEQFRYFNPIVVFVCDPSVKRDGVVKYVLERTYKQLGTIAIIGVTENTNNDDNKYSYTYEKLLVFKNNVFSEWAGSFFEEIEAMTTKSVYKGSANTEIPFPLQTIFFGAPGTGKSDTVDRITQYVPHTRTTFHPDSDYASFVGAYKPTMKRSTITKDGVTTTDEKIVYRFIPQAFLKAYCAAWKQMPEPYFLVIEEINRGNCAQIFGDLFQLLDRDNEGFSKYGITADDDIERFLCSDEKVGFVGLSNEQREQFPDEAIWKGKELRLPPNLYIWATMNTSDQSLFPIDSAFKRRWEWKYIKITNGYEKKDNGDFKRDANGNKIKLDWKIETNGEDWYGFICQINRIISNMTSSADKQLGYFFCQANEDRKITTETFVSKVIFYLWNDVFKDYGFEDASLFKYKKVDKDGNRLGDDLDLTFPDFYGEDGNVVPDVVKQFIEHVMAWKGDEKKNNN